MSPSPGSSDPLSATRGAPPTAPGPGQAGGSSGPVGHASPASAPAPAPVPSGSPILAPRPVPADSPALTPRVEGPSPAPARDGPLCHGSAPCRRLVILGAVAGGLGLGAIITGAALLARPLAVDPVDPTTLVTYRPAGAAFLAVGAGLAATWLLTLLTARKAGRLAQRLRAAAPVP